MSGKERLLRRIRYLCLCQHNRHVLLTVILPSKTSTSINLHHTPLIDTHKLFNKLTSFNSLLSRYHNIIKVMPRCCINCPDVATSLLYPIHTFRYILKKFCFISPICTSVRFIRIRCPMYSIIPYPFSVFFRN